MKARKIEDPSDNRAEGVFVLKDGTEIPFDTNIVSSQGCHCHFWLGGEKVEEHERMLVEVMRIARDTRDVVSASYSLNKNEGFWTRERVRFSA